MSLPAVPLPSTSRALVALRSNHKQKMLSPKQAFPTRSQHPTSTSRNPASSLPFRHYAPSLPKQPPSEVAVPVATRLGQVSIDLESPHL
ncbi:uncharacterized protein K441DRAFT_370890 [Cenococcum geophilum 1.58]|uniref:uncharacterized protein n=1 Tax=Cenococcum geophilum 1.58 TaxID=794803 RepID=UPI003590033C|nr:hypothetical protein K441DRAFT_370890 [Cenococcum geophilum 1.58]